MTTALIYRNRHITQKLRDREGRLIGCTDTCLAMLADAVTFGGIVGVTEAVVRMLSDERIPDPESPGLNLRQIVAVAKKLRIQLYDRSGQDAAQLRTYLDRNQRAIVQVWYGDLGGGNIGHAVHVQARRLRHGAWAWLINDPIQTAAEWRPETDMLRAANTWARRTGVPGDGLRFAVGRLLPYQAVTP